jgi:Icc-related predicted phosphoesterase
LTFYGSPWQPTFYDWAFNLDRQEPCAAKWRQIPDGVDVLITHGPPLGHGDLVNYDRQHVGCVDLLREIQLRVRPRLHVFGHIHEGHGVTTDGVTVYANAATCDEKYRAVQPPLVFDLPLKRPEIVEAL